MPARPVWLRGGDELFVDTAQLRLAPRNASTTSGSNCAPRWSEDLVDRDVLPREGRAVRAVARHRVERVGDGEDPAADRDLVATEAGRGSRCRPTARGGCGSRRSPGPGAAAPPRATVRRAGVRPHHAPLLPRQRARLLEDRVGDPDLADVVEQEAVLEARVVEQRGSSCARELGRVADDALASARRCRNPSPRAPARRRRSSPRRRPSAGGAGRARARAGGAGRARRGAAAPRAARRPSGGTGPRTGRRRAARRCRAGRAG